MFKTSITQIFKLFKLFKSPITLIIQPPPTTNSNIKIQLIILIYTKAMKVLKKYESFEPEEEWVDYEDITFDFNRPVYDMFEIPFKINDRVHIETKNGPYGHTVTNGTIRAIYISNMREYSHVIISILLENERIVWDFNGIDYQVMITPLPIYESFNPEEYWEEHEIIEPNKKYFVTKKNWSKLAKVLIENGYKWYSGEKISTKKNTL